MSGTNVYGQASVVALPITLTGVNDITQAPIPLLNSGALTCNSSAGVIKQIVAYSATRNFIHIFSRTTGNEVVDLGPLGVVVGGGIPISSGGGFTFLGSGAAGPIYAICPVASSPLSFVEG